MIPFDASRKVCDGRQSDNGCTAERFARQAHGRGQQDRQHQQHREAAGPLRRGDAQAGGDALDRLLGVLEVCAAVPAVQLDGRDLLAAAQQVDHLRLPDGLGLVAPLQGFEHFQRGGQAGARRRAVPLDRLDLAAFGQQARAARLPGACLRWAWPRRPHRRSNVLPVLQPLVMGGQVGPGAVHGPIQLGLLLQSSSRRSATARAALSTCCGVIRPGIGAVIAGLQRM